MRSLFLSSILFLSIYVHGYSQAIDADTTNKNYMEFGNGGGFTGAVHSYLLAQNGNLYRMESAAAADSKAVFIKQVRRCHTKQIFRYAVKNNLTTLQYSDPGNMYAFITIQVDRHSNTLTWKNKSAGTPAPVLKLSEMLHKLL